MNHCTALLLWNRYCASILLSLSGRLLGKLADKQPDRRMARHWRGWLPRSNKNCPICKHEEAVFFQSQQRNADTGMKLFYVCCECGHIFQ
ncbi:hypothetical protein GGR52DRAFT_21560 [Hypoxylon sp. FL1284]|nr:hypothetical protein GGR52DRAFT_21560 [Hypoxylon sp. FL1284]